MSVPLLILSDSPTAGSGLGRITHDLASRIAVNLPEFRVACAGYGGKFSTKLGYPFYEIDMKDWVVYNLPDIWQDFAGDERGIVFTIWDASRMLWFARPENCGDKTLQAFLQNPPFQRWGYFPIDATGPHDQLTGVLKYTLEGYDRVLAYSKWAADILTRTCFHEHEFLPHGIDTSVFYPRPRVQARHGFGQKMGAKSRKGKWLSIPDDAFLVGIVATNQIRKDWALGIQVVAELSKDRNVFLWCHTDLLERHWSLPALINDFGINTERTVVTTIKYTDEQMAWAYSACDVTLGIGLGEGFGYPIFESLACGTPCIHGNYGGAAEHIVGQPFLVQPKMYRLEGPYNSARPVFDPMDWYTTILQWQGRHAHLLADLDWNNLWPRWAEWIKAGLPQPASGIDIVEADQLLRNTWNQK